MQLKNKQIVDAQSALGKMLNTALPAKQSYHIKKTLESVKKQAVFLEERRTDLIKKYGVEKNGNYSIPDDDLTARKKYFDEYKELLELEEEIDVRQITLDELDRVELTANELESIEFMLKIED
ncbi:hypothetical protein [[Clostridium] innocuum]|jgi:hypothetical protein|uniref:hypothetical protein n=1 Tax=Clostridium innocuum TaxID=1522 RepID=UPI003A4D299D